MRLTRLVRVVPINSGIHEKIIWYAMASNVGDAQASTTPLRAAHLKGRTFIVAIVDELVMCHHVVFPKEKALGNRAENAPTSLFLNAGMMNNAVASDEDAGEAEAQRGHAVGDHRHQGALEHGQIHDSAHSTWWTLIFQSRQMLKLIS